MTDKEKFVDFIKNFDESEYNGTYAAEASEMYGDYVMEMEHDDRASSYAEEGFILGFIWAKTSIVE